MKSFLSKYGGVVIGSLYGLIMRLFFGVGFSNNAYEFADLFSITFVWIVPIVIGVVPMFLATREQLASFSYRVTRPVLTVLLFFIIVFSTGAEDLICIIIISIPFLLAAFVGGLIFAKVIEKWRNWHQTLYSLLVIPFLIGFVEEKFSIPSENFQVSTVVVVNSTAEVIWENIIRVKQINETEYEKGFFNYAGIPRPLYAELNADTLGATRIGHFEGGLTFHETLTECERNKRVAFNIKVIPGSIRQTIFDQHVLNGDHFKFLNAAYNLESLGNGKTKLTLSSSYQLKTRINGYSAFWGQNLLTDFQERLLAVIKMRCEQSVLTYQKTTN